MKIHMIITYIQLYPKRIEQTSMDELETFSVIRFLEKGTLHE